MNKSDKRYHDLTQIEKRIYENVYCALIANKDTPPYTKDKIHELCIAAAEGFSYMIEDNPFYNPAD